MWHFSNTDSEGRRGWRFWSSAGARLDNLGNALSSGAAAASDPTPTVLMLGGM